MKDKPIYPNLFVTDGVQGGSMTFGRSRLPVWCIFAHLCSSGWAGVIDNWPQLTEYGWTEERLALFLRDLTNPRGELARLLAVISEVERRRDLAAYPRRINKRESIMLSNALQAALGQVGYFDD